ncbi:Uncharacterized protein FKW44_016212, partial [Caligus rogercresseyi]
RYQFQANGGSSETRHVRFRLDEDARDESSGRLASKDYRALNTIVMEVVAAVAMINVGPFLLASPLHHHPLPSTPGQ